MNCIPLNFSAQVYLLGLYRYEWWTPTMEKEGSLIDEMLDGPRWSQVSEWQAFLRFCPWIFLSLSLSLHTSCLSDFPGQRGKWPPTPFSSSLFHSKDQLDCGAVHTRSIVTTWLQEGALPRIRLGREMEIQADKLVAQTGKIFLPSASRLLCVWPERRNHLQV